MALTPFDVGACMDGLKLLVDTREQDTYALRRRLKMTKLPWERKKLDFGDYSASFPLPDGTVFSLENRIAIERKMSLDELAQCLTHDRPRFKREFERAKMAGAKIYLLCENGSWGKIYRHEYRSKMHENAYIHSLLSWMEQYGFQIIFCEPMYTGQMIHDIICREAMAACDAMIEEGGFLLG